MNTLFDDFEARVVAKSSDEYYTPKWVFDAIGLEFDIDVCAPETGPLHTPARRWYSAADDGLEQPWEGRVWMNPPYSRVTPWITKWLAHGNGIALVPHTKSLWYGELWNANTAVVTLPSNLEFVKPSGETAGIFMPTALWAVGDTNIEALTRSNIGKVR